MSVVEGDTRKPRGTGWMTVGFNRGGCYDCAWNRNADGELMAASLSAVRAHAREAGHMSFELRKSIRDFNGRPR